MKAIQFQVAVHPRDERGPGHTELYVLFDDGSMRMIYNPMDKTRESMPPELHGWQAVPMPEAKPWETL